jgi:eukaryotic-like serine/threonine-protein kinase
VHVTRKEEVLDALGKAATSLRKRLGESLTSIQKFDIPLDQATTSSLEALKAYSLSALPDDSARGPLLQHAIELDPNFADAYVQLSTRYDAAGEAELASDYAQKAFDHREHATERERLYITAIYYALVQGDLDQEMSIHRALEQMYPRDWGAWNDSASDLISLGDYEGAVKQGQEALRLNPTQLNAYLNLGGALLALNRRDEVKQIAKRAQERGLDATDVHILLYGVAFLENDAKEMEAQLTPLLAKPDGGEFDALAMQSRTEAYSGRLKNSLVFLKRGLEIARRGNENELAAQVRDAEALEEAEFGNPGDARRTAAMALTFSTGRNAKLFTALALARAGDATHAQALADELNRQFPSHTLLQRYWLPTIRGSIALARKNPAKALDALQQVSYELGDADAGTLAGNLYPVYVRGQAYLGARQGKEAAAEFQKFLDNRSIVLNSPLGALAHLGLARAYSLQGDTANAREAYLGFLALWKDADPNIPILKEAQAEYAKLQ